MERENINDIELIYSVSKKNYQMNLKNKLLAIVHDKLGRGELIIVNKKLVVVKDYAQKEGE